jgi:diguanylate cyclase (GGDEF)-like protein
MVTTAMKRVENRVAAAAVRVRRAEKAARRAYAAAEAAAAELKEADVRAAEAEAEAEALRRRLYTDWTGVYTREWLEDAWPTLPPSGALAPAALLLIDVNRFKSINDAWGHRVGDKVLRSVAARLPGGFRYLPVRIGGDEFALVCSASGAGVVATAAMLGTIMRAPIPVDGLPEPLHVSLSTGSTLVTPREPLSEALHRADVAMYHAKVHSRCTEGNCHVQWQVDMVMPPELDVCGRRCRDADRRQVTTSYREVLRGR